MKDFVDFAKQNIQRMPKSSVWLAFHKNYVFKKRGVFIFFVSESYCCTWHMNVDKYPCWLLVFQNQVISHYQQKVVKSSDPLLWRSAEKNKNILTFI